MILMKKMPDSAVSQNKKIKTFEFIVQLGFCFSVHNSSFSRKTIGIAWKVV